jgi:hypothetical protein
MSISLTGDAGGQSWIFTDANYTYDSTAGAPSLSILFDLSRMLRFYNGCNLQHEGGVNPPDPADKAYFFCHSVFGLSVAAFFGPAGQIQGYETVYNANNEGVPGWMTIVCNPDGDILSGLLIGNDDNALTIAKGNLTSVSGTNPYDFHYSISNVDVTGFEKLTDLGDSTDVSWHQLPDSSGTPERTGDARFFLRFQTE